jgi:hypothetical protein
VNSYHLNFFGPLKSEYVDWPANSVSVYHISGEQIADRIIRAELVKHDRYGGYYRGEVIARHPWPGYLGCFKSLTDAAELITEHRAYVAFAEAERAAGKQAIVAWESWRKNPRE